MGCFDNKKAEQLVIEKNIEIGGVEHRVTYSRVIQGWNEKTGTLNIIETILRQYDGTDKNAALEVEYRNKHLNNPQINNKLAKFAGTSVANGTDLDEIIIYEPFKTPQNSMERRPKEIFYLYINLLGNPAMAYQQDRFKDTALVRTEDADHFSRTQALSALKRFKGMVTQYQTIYDIMIF